VTGRDLDVVPRLSPASDHMSNEDQEDEDHEDPDEDDEPGETCSGVHLVATPQDSNGPGDVFWDLVAVVLRGLVGAVVVMDAGHVDEDVVCGCLVHVETIRRCIPVTIFHLVHTHAGRIGQHSSPIGTRAGVKLHSAAEVLADRGVMVVEEDLEGVVAISKHTGCEFETMSLVGG